MQKYLKTFYEIVMLCLVVLTIMTLWTTSTYNSIINWIVWAVFFIDFIIRLFKAKQKWLFIKQNPFLIIAIIPFDQFFQMARIVRLIYFFRIKTIVKYYVAPFIKKLTYQSITKIILFVIGILLLQAIIIWKIEVDVTTIQQALYVVFSHLLFFGHHMIVVNQKLSITLLTIISIVGVILQGIALQWAFEKLEVLYRKWKQKEFSKEDSGNNTLLNRLEDEQND